MQMDSSISEMPMGVVGSVGYVSGHPLSPQFPMSNKKTTLGSDNPLSHDLPSGDLDHTLQSQQILTPTNQTGPMANSVAEQMSAPIKRKAPVELSMPQKRVAQMLHRPWLQQQIAVQNKKAAQPESMPNSPGSLNSPASNRKLVKTDSFSNKSGSQRTPTQKVQSRTRPASKGAGESSESVRSKMREQLAAVLSLVTEQDAKRSLNDGNCQGKAMNSEATQGSHQPGNESNDSVENFSSAKKNGDADVQAESQKIMRDAIPSESTSIYDGGFQSTYGLSYEDVPFSENFFDKDELLQGNGLSWVLDPVLELAEKPKLDGEEASGDRLEEPCQQSPEDVALEIEAELFELFGGVNKKYKEKGRSLLFNLKDRNNPELRERVMAGEISPKRLCSMTAEELASKELSEWRMAKAEELAQMVVLPDTEVDIRRLVRKTHKGEFQVEVEQDDSLPVDISGRSSSFYQGEPRNKDTEIPTTKPSRKRDLSKAHGKKNNVDERTPSRTFTIPPSEGTDLMQGLMADDELKDVDFLPPIVSLDEFMESLNSEPPFENLPLDSERTSLSEKDDSDSGSKSSDLTSKDIADNLDLEKPSDSNLELKSIDKQADVKSKDRFVDVKSSRSSLSKKTALPLSVATKADRVWEGSLQLNVSSTANVVGVFKSGEKTSANEWPGLIDIKGRVRLDAFEKFLNQLPLSRSRAVMVVHFILKEGSPENELISLQEVSDSYVVDERVGFAEPASGVELYFCPPHNKTLEMLGKVIPKEQIESLNKINNGLIGVIVFRKLSSTSPKSSSSLLHKHSSKKQHSTSRKQQDLKLKPALINQSKPPPTDDDDEGDVPPGFGPLAVAAAARDEDDLPEFNFSGGSSNPPSTHGSRRPGMVREAFRVPPLPSRPVEQVRELIHKYGQQSNALPAPQTQSWNDDDDDIPEWQPQVPIPAQQVQNFRQPAIRPHYINQPHVLQTVQPPHLENLAAAWHQQGNWWAGSAQPNSSSSQPDVGQYHGALGRGMGGQPSSAWEQNVSKSRGF